MKRTLKTLFALISVCALTACTVVNSQARSVIDANAANASYINAKVQADPALPPYAKTWWKSEAETWQSMSAWAHGNAPTPAVK